MLDISSVRVTGVTDVLQQVASVQATLSVAGATQTVTRVVSLQAVDSNGRSVSGVTITPPTVTVTVPVQSPQVSASLTPQLVGTPAAGYAVSAVSVQPKTVQLRGDAAAMANLLAISVPVDVQGLKASTVLRVAIPHPTGVSSMTPSTVRVSVTVEPAETKEFSGLPVKVQDAPDGTGVKIVSPQTVDVTVSGAKSILDRLQPQDVTVYVDASNVTAADTSAPLNVAIPNWVQVTNMSDSTAQIQVTESGDKT
ncbi:hypothetical protein GCM10025857_17730 [Alicyclobacillus contaminans]|nr:hypothetical protein GCM10025857_17730 [Alicyclobacillus contaminans]